MAEVEEQIEDRIAAIEKEIRETPYHKATQHHIGRLRARIAKLKDEIFQRQMRAGRGGGGEGFAQKKYGDATAVLLGFPSIGKSTLLNKLTNAQSKVAAYDFTTLEVIPGMMDYQGAKIQIFDIPGIVSGAAHGRGRGREILSVARAADLIIIMADAKNPKQLEQIENELSAAGLRLNQKPPSVAINKKIEGGIKVVSPVLNPQTVEEVAKEFRLVNAEIIVKGNITLEQLIDVLIGNRVYIPSLHVINKIDLLPKINSSDFGSDVVLISAEKETGLEDLKKKIWEKLGLFRVFLKPQGANADLENPLVLKVGDTILTAAKKVHGELAENIKAGQIWGKSAKFPGQTVSLNHSLQEGDTITFLLRNKSL